MRGGPAERGRPAPSHDRPHRELRTRAESTFSPEPLADRLRRNAVLSGAASEVAATTPALVMSGSIGSADAKPACRCPVHPVRVR